MIVMQFKFRFPNLIILALLTIVFNACQKQLPNDKVIIINETKVTTIIHDTISSPIQLGGLVESNTEDSIIEKGILYGIDSNLSVGNGPNVNINYTSPGILPAGYIPVVDLTTGGWASPSLSPASIKAAPGKGAYRLNVQGTKGITKYYVRAYAKTAKETFYGNTLSFTTANYKRQMGVNLGFSNVFWTASYTLFDLLTDEVILPDASGNYTIWYSSNEDINVYSTTKSIAQLPSFLFYKFKTQANCQRWCDLRSGRVKP